MLGAFNCVLRLLSPQYDPYQAPQFWRCLDPISIILILVPDTCSRSYDQEDPGRKVTRRTESQDKENLKHNLDRNIGEGSPKKQDMKGQIKSLVWSEKEQERVKKAKESK